MLEKSANDLNQKPLAEQITVCMNRTLAGVTILVQSMRTSRRRTIAKERCGENLTWPRYIKARVE